MSGYLSTIEENTALFHQDGYLKLPGIFERETIHLFQDIAMKNYQEARHILESNDISIGIGIKEGFKDMVQRHQDRFEMPYKMDSEIFDRVFEQTAVISQVKSILGDDCVVINKSLIMSLAGAKVMMTCSTNQYHNFIVFVFFFFLFFFI